MYSFLELGAFSSIIAILLIPFVFWEITWKSFALWKSARRNQLGWFICLIIFNTAGILPIIYLLIYRDKKECLTSENYETKDKNY
jgi:membrane protease YdiL (CAAX protease family)